MKTIQCHPETGYGCSKNLIGLSPGAVPEQTTSTGFARIYQQIHSTMKYETCGKGTSVVITVLKGCRIGQIRSE